MTWPPVSDGVVTLRPFETGDREAVIAGRDREVRRWLGPGSEQPAPTACIVAAGATVGWVDYDDDQPWLEIPVDVAGVEGTHRDDPVAVADRRHWAGEEHLPGGLGRPNVVGGQRRRPNPMAVAAR